VASRLSSARVWESTGLLAFLSVGMTACELSEPVGSWVVALTGGSTPVAVPSVAASRVPSLEELAQSAAKRAQQNAEFLQEMFRVVLLKEPQASPEFSGLLDSLNQGATFEGVYNGLTHSSAYRDVETASPSASPETLKAFSEELAALELELKERTLFDSRSGKPLARMEQPTGQESGDLPAGVSAEAMAPQRAAATAPALSAEYMKVFVGASTYTLKRVLGDEAIKLISVKGAGRADLVEWYVKFVTRLADRKVDFGLDLRNKVDLDFHRNWAMTASVDKLQWEVLNRLHRVLNVGLPKR